MKKYSDKYINSYNILKTAVIGFEFEFYSNVSYYKTLEIMNYEYDPVKVHGFRKYHSTYKPDKDNFKIEPDLSGGSNMVELVTGPLPYYDAKYYLLKSLSFIQKYGYTNDKCSVHINISFDKNLTDRSIKDLNILKHILRTDEDEIYRYFPSRAGNIYAKSIKRIIPYKQYDFSNISIGSIQNSIRVPSDKYYGINMFNIGDGDDSRLEYRYLGGKGYENMSGDIMYFMDKFILTTYNNIGAGFDDKDVDELEYYLDKNISNFKNFSKYDSFLVDFPTIELQVNQSNLYELVSAYYDNIYAEIYELMDSADSLKDCTINYVTQLQKIEIVDAKIKSSLNMEGYDFIECEVLDGIFNKCNFINCDVNNVQLTKCNIDGSDIKGSKILECNVDSTDLNNCYFVSGYLNGNMEGGVYRSGKLGPYGSISSSTKIVSDDDNFFNIKYGANVDDLKGSKLMKGKK